MTYQYSKSLIVRLKKFRNFFNGYMIGCLEGTFRRVEPLAHLTIFHLFEVTKLEDDTLNIGQAGHSLLQQCLHLSTIKIIVGHQTIGHWQDIVDANPAVLVMAQEIKTLVDGNARQPRANLGITVKITQSIPSFQESVLEHIVGIVMREHNATNLPIELLAILTHNLLKGTTLGLWILKLRQ